MRVALASLALSGCGVDRVLVKPTEDFAVGRGHTAKAPMSYQEAMRSLEAHVRQLRIELPIEGDFPTLQGARSPSPLIRRHAASTSTQGGFEITRFDDGSQTARIIRALPTHWWQPADGRR